MPAYAGILQGIMTLMLGTRLVLRAQMKAGPLGLDDVRQFSTDNKASLMVKGSTHTVIPRSNDLHRPHHPWDREVRHGPTHLGRSGVDVRVHSLDRLGRRNRLRPQYLLHQSLRPPLLPPPHPRHLQQNLEGNAINTHLPLQNPPLTNPLITST